MSESIQEKADALKQAVKSAEEAAHILKKEGYIASDVGKALKDTFKQNIDTLRFK